ncbi:MAG: hypothetical protein AB7O97_18685 [Planctomycetota bacterium]
MKLHFPRVPVPIWPSPLLFVALLATAPARDLAAQDLIYRCENLVVAPDTVVSPGELLVRDGKVMHVGGEIPIETRARTRVVAFDGATIVPGFVLAHATLGQERDLAERAAPMTPGLRAAEAFDPFADELAALPRAGVTSCWLSPSSDNVAGGLAALVKPGRAGDMAMGTVRVDQGYAKFALGRPAAVEQSAPTSLMGAVDLLRQAFLAAGRGGGPVDAAVSTVQPSDLPELAAVLRGERPAVLQADSRAELLAALGLARELGFTPVLLGAAAAPDLLDRLAAARAPLLLRPLRPEMRDEELRLPAELERRGVPFAFVGPADQLRPAAALAVRHGCSRKVALAALTRTPAELCGSAAIHGALRRGCDADFAVFTGDPLDLGARLLATYVGGERLFGDAPPARVDPRELAARGGDL